MMICRILVLVAALHGLGNVGSCAAAAEAADVSAPGDIAGTATPNERDVNYVFRSQTGAWQSTRHIRGQDETWRMSTSDTVCRKTEPLSLICWDVPQTGHSTLTYKDGILTIEDAASNGSERQITKLTVSGLSYENRQNWWMTTTFTEVLEEQGYEYLEHRIRMGPLLIRTVGLRREGSEEPLTHFFFSISRRHEPALSAGNVPDTDRHSMPMSYAP